MIASLVFLCAVVKAEEGPHNSLEEWDSLFSSFNPVSSHGRRLGSGPSVEFSATQIAHRGRVNVIVSDPSLVNNSLCNLTYIALFTPPTANVNTTTPIRYQSMLFDPSFCQTGNASFSFSLHNMHTGGYVAYLLQGGVKQTTVVTPQTTFYTSGAKPWTDLTGNRPGRNLKGTVLATSSAPVTFFEPNEPTHLRLTAGLTPGTLRVSWNQGEDSMGGFVRWSNSSSQSAYEGGTLVTDASRSTFTINDVCSLGPAAGPGFRSMATQWSAVLNVANYSGLTVYYVVGDATNVSRAFELKVPLFPGETSTFAQEWIMYADNGVGYDDDSYNGRNYNNGRIAASIIKAASFQSKARRLQGVIVNGDVTYADGYLAQIEDYMDLAETHGSMVPFLTTVGNHESDWYRNHNGSVYDSPDNSTPTGDYWATDIRPDNSISSGGECGVAMKVWPQAEATAQKPWYVHAAGLLTTVFISTEHDFTTGSEQWKWINATLASIDHTKTPWVLVSGHRPMYLTYDYSDPGWGGIQVVSQMMQQHLEPLYKKYKVSLSLAGHVHNTQRMCAVYADKCTLETTTSKDGYEEYLNPENPIYFLLGSAGATTDLVGVNRSDLLLYGNDEPAYALLSIQSASILEIQLMDPLSNRTMDRARIVRLPVPPGHPILHWAFVAAAGGVCILIILLLIYRRKQARLRMASVHPATYKAVK